MRDVIDEISLAEVDRDLAIETGLLEDTRSLSLVGAVDSVHLVEEYGACTVR